MKKKLLTILLAVMMVMIFPITTLAAPTNYSPSDEVNVQLAECGTILNTICDFDAIISHMTGAGYTQAEIDMIHSIYNATGAEVVESLLNTLNPAQFEAMMSSLNLSNLIELQNAIQEIYVTYIHMPDGFVSGDPIVAHIWAGSAEGHTAGDWVTVLHLINGEWEYLGTFEVDENGMITVEMTDFSPVAFVWLNQGEPAPGDDEENGDPAPGAPGAGTGDDQRSPRTGLSVLPLILMGLFATGGIAFFGKKPASEKND